jgi:uncharacterized membrane protein YhaH (DUF805 family)
MLRTYFSFAGRMSRRDFWIWFNGGYVAVFFVLRFVALSDPALGAELQLGVMLVTLWPRLATLTKRMHDRGRPLAYTLALYVGSFVLGVCATLFPPWHLALTGAGWLLGAVLGIEAQFMRGQDDPNRFGPDPLEGERWDGSTASRPPEDMRRRAFGR